MACLHEIFISLSLVKMINFLQEYLSSIALQYTWSWWSRVIGLLNTLTPSVLLNWKHTLHIWQRRMQQPKFTSREPGQDSVNPIVLPTNIPACSPQPQAKPSSFCSKANPSSLCDPGLPVIHHLSVTSHALDLCLLLLLPTKITTHL